MLIDVISAQISIFLGFKYNVESLKHIKTLIFYTKFCPGILGKSISFFLGHPVEYSKQHVYDLASLKLVGGGVASDELSLTLLPQIFLIVKNITP